MFKTFVRSASAASRQCRRCSCCAPIVASDPDTKISVLSNGVRVATEATGSSVACVSLFVEAGSRFEVACNNGVSHLIEHLAFTGFNTLCKQELDSQLLSTGTKLSSKTTREIQYFSASFLPLYTPNTIDLLSKVVTDLYIDDNKIEEAKYGMCLEMADAENNPKALVFDYLHQTAFQGTNLALSVIGPTRNVQLFNANYCYEYLRDHYQPYKLCMAASGGIVHEDILHYTEKCLGHLDPQNVCVSEEGPRRYTGSEVRYRDDSMPFVHVAIAVEAAGYGTPDYLPLLIARNILGSWDRSQGRDLRNGSPLARAAATSQLCERFEAFYLPYKDIGLWGVYFVCDKMCAEDMMFNIQNEWMHLCTTLHQGDIERGVNATKLELSRCRAGAMNSCHDIGMQVMYTCNRKSIDDLYNEMNEAKVVVKSVCDKYIYDRCPVLAAVGPTEALTDYARVRSGMHWLRL